MDRRGRQRIKIDKIKEYEVRREYQERLGELYEVHKVKRYWMEGDVELAWNKMKEGIVGRAKNLCGVVKGRKGSEKHTRWWNDQVKVAVRRKKSYVQKVTEFRH